MVNEYLWEAKLWSGFIQGGESYCDSRLQCSWLQQSCWCRDWFFCCVHCSSDLQCFSVAGQPPKLPLFLRELDPRLIHVSLGSPWHGSWRFWECWLLPLFLSSCAVVYPVLLFYPVMNSFSQYPVLCCCTVRWRTVVNLSLSDGLRRLSLKAAFTACTRM